MQGKPRSHAGLLSALLLAISLSTACTGLPTNPILSEDLTPEMLLAGEPLLRGEPVPALPEVDLLGMTPEMIDYVEQRVDPGKHPEIVLRQLTAALIEDQSFIVDYSGATHTAAETFNERSGNCLAFTNLFLAMARHSGLDAFYQSVDVPPSWGRQGDTLILDRHINVLVTTRASLASSGSSRHVVDFNISEYKSIYEQKVISDDQARAHYHSNLAVETMQTGDLRGALAHIRRGIEYDQRHSPLWLNLGALYARIDALAYAEASYLTALKYNRLSLPAMSNLVRVYERAGEAERAAQYSERVASYRARNPYYRLFEAQRLYAEKQYDEAIEQLEYAIRLRPEEDGFYFLLGEAYLQKGDTQLARHYLETAREVAVDESVKKRYTGKIEHLLGYPDED